MWKFYKLTDYEPRMEEFVSWFVYDNTGTGKSVGIGVCFRMEVQVI